MHRFLLAGVLAAFAGSAMGDVVTFYSNDFEHSSKVGPEWTSRPIWSSNGNFSGHIGRFTRETHVLELAAFHPPKPGGNGGGGNEGGGDGEPGGGGDGGGGGGNGGGGGIGDGGGGIGGGRTATTDFTLEFDLFVVDSWDGGFAGQYGPDYFGVKINGLTVLWEAIHSVKLEQNFMMPAVGPVHLGGNSAYKDSIFRDISLSFTLGREVETLRIEFIGLPSSDSLSDESWGLDNVRVSAHAVPAPGAMAVGLLGGLASLRRRRVGC